MGIGGRRSAHLLTTAAFLAGGEFAPVFGQEDEPAPPAVLTALYTADVWSVVSGGLGHGTRYLDNLDLMAEIDTEAAFGWRGGTFFLYGLYNNGNELTSLVGDAQVITNIEAVDAIRLFEAWFDQSFADGAVSLRAGLYNLNAEFDVTDSAALFINSSHGIQPTYSQTGVAGPSIFPVTSLAVRAAWQPIESVTLQAAVLDAVPGDPDRPRRTAIKLGNGEGALLAGEVNVEGGGMRLGVGGWHYTAEFDHIELTLPFGDPVRRGGNSGGYVFAEGHLLGRPGGDPSGLWGFARAGFAQSRLNQFGTDYAIGLQYRGLFAEDDAAGVALSMAVNGNPYRRAQAAAGIDTDKAETNIELTYALPLTDWLTLQPDVQYVINPSTDPAIKNALAVGLRVKIGSSYGF